MGDCNRCLPSPTDGAMRCGGEPDPCAMMGCPEVLCPEEGQCKRRGFYDCCVGAEVCTFDGCCGAQCDNDGECADQRDEVCGRCSQRSDGIYTCGGQ